MGKCQIGVPVTLVAKFVKRKVERERFAVCYFSTTDMANVPAGANPGSFEAAGSYEVPLYSSALLEMNGEWVINTYNGRSTLQFSVRYLYPIMPRTPEESVIFIRGISGIGLHTAQAIIAKYGDIDSALADENVLLATVKGLQKGKLERLKRGVTEVSAVRDMVTLLSGFGINNMVIAIVAQKYGAASMEMVKNHPYEMLKDVNFEDCDKIALSQGWPASGSPRIQAAIYESVMSIRSMRNSIIVDGVAVINTALEKCNTNDNGVVTEADIRKEMKAMLCGDDAVLANSKQYVYLREDYDVECSLAQQFAELGKKQGNKADVAKYWTKFDKWKKQNTNVSLAKNQELAVQAAANPLSVVTGGPGTGKTTVLKAIIDTYQMTFPDSPVTLMAPTGLAAKRMSESCGMRALTIHKAFGLKPADNGAGFTADDSENIPGGLVICDEFSMVPLHLANFIIEGVGQREDTRIVFVGDVDQLPPVSPGAVLDALIRCGKVKVTRLTKNFRQEAGSAIIDLAYAINEGHPEDIRYTGDVVMDEVRDENVDVEAGKILDEIKNTFMAKIAQYGLENTFVLSATHRPSKMHPEYVLYSNNINEMLRDAVNPRIASAWLEHAGREFRLHDRVINLRNRDECINGDIGTIVSIDTLNKRFVVDFDGNHVVFEADHFKDLELAYCITVHKSQGCEFGCVIMPCSMTQRFMMTKKLVYTAVTRAKHEMIFIGDKRMVSDACTTEDRIERRDLLGARIVKAAAAA